MRARTDRIAQQIEAQTQCVAVARPGGALCLPRCEWSERQQLYNQPRGRSGTFGRATSTVAPTVRTCSRSSGALRWPPLGDRFDREAWLAGPDVLADLAPYSTLCGANADLDLLRPHSVFGANHNARVSPVAVRYV